MNSLNVILAIGDKGRFTVMAHDKETQDNAGLIECMNELVSANEYFWEDLPSGIYSCKYIVREHHCRYPDCACDEVDDDFIDLKWLRSFTIDTKAETYEKVALSFAIEMLNKKGYIVGFDGLKVILFPKVTNLIGCIAFEGESMMESLTQALEHVEASKK